MGQKGYSPMYPNSADSTVLCYDNLYFIPPPIRFSTELQYKYVVLLSILNQYKYVLFFLTEM